ALERVEGNVETFTGRTPGDEVDEAPAAVETARRLGISHEIVAIEKDGPGVLDELTDAYGEPFSCSSALGMLRVSRAVRSKATVLLTGDGGDDVFLGYRVHPNFWTAQRLASALPPGSTAFWKMLRPMADAIPTLRRLKHLLDFATGGLGAVTRAHDGLPYYRTRNMLGERLDAGEIDQRRIPLSRKSARRVLLDAL